MDTLAYFNTEEDYQAQRYTVQMSIVQFVHNAKKNEFRYKINPRG